MQDKKYLMIPGPTPVPPTVIAAMSKPMIGHRSGDFAVLYQRLEEKIKKVFQTENEVFILTHSGTGGMEAAIANVINPGDEVLALITGNFGERFANIAKAYGAKVEEVNFGWGKDVDLNIVADKLAQKEYKAVLATQNETSTGVLNDIAGIGALTAKTPALLLVDGVSGVGGIEVKTDTWYIDMLITSSQKAFMLPPGLAMVSVSPKAWEVVNQNKAPRFYFSLPEAKKSLAKWNSAFTPNVSLFMGLEAALDMMLAEGLPGVYARHIRLAKAARAAVRALGLDLLTHDHCASPTVTAIFGPAGIDVEELRKVLRQEFGVTFAGGQGILKGKIFRIAHLGFVDKMDIIIAVGALEMALARLGCPLTLGAGIKAAQEIFLKGEI